MPRPRIPFFSLLVLLLIINIISQTTASSSKPTKTPTTFCKCTCFSNSTIIPLDPPESNPSSSSAHNNPSSSPASSSSSSCTKCNRAFCLDYNLPICKDATENDVFTTCFQRDSLKDETVVVLFLVITAGLLGWAGVKEGYAWVQNRGGNSGMIAGGGRRRGQGRGGTGYRDLRNGGDAVVAGDGGDEDRGGGSRQDGGRGG